MKEKKELKSDLSLFEYFKPGDRVKRKTFGKNAVDEFEGLIMSMDNDHLEIYWDTVNGTYCPGSIEEEFTNCSINEALYGTDDHSPLKQKKHLLGDIFN